MRIPQLIAAVALATSISLTAATPVPSDFTYQGVLKVDGQPVQTDADFIIRLYDGATLVTSITRNLVPINDGQFALNLNFDPAFFDGTDYDLEFLVRSPAGIGAYQTLGSRQPLSTTPYAYHANSANTLLAPARIDANTSNPAVEINQANESAGITALRGTRGAVDSPSILDGTLDRVAEFESANTPIAVIGVANQFGLVGLMDMNANPFGGAVLAEVRSNGFATQAAVWAQNNPAGTQAYLARGDYAGEFFGDVRVSGDIIRSFTPGSNDFATPIAYGHINTDGTIAAGTPNFSAVWNSTTSRYEILIDNESYFFNDYVTVVTPITSNASVRTSSFNGRLLVFIQSTVNQANIQAGFQFVTFKPNGAALVQGQRRAQLRPLDGTITDKDLYPYPATPQPRIPVDTEPNITSPTARD